MKSLESSDIIVVIVVVAVIAAAIGIFVGWLTRLIASWEMTKKRRLLASSLGSIIGFVLFGSLAGFYFDSHAKRMSEADIILGSMGSSYHTANVYASAYGTMNDMFAILGWAFFGIIVGAVLGTWIAYKTKKQSNKQEA